MELTVIRAAKASLQAAGIVQPRSVFYTPHDTFMPTGTHCPAIGIKDGKAIKKELAGEMIEEVYQVECIAWVNMSADGETALVGDNGIMALVAAIESTLDRNRLSVTEIHHARATGSQPSRLFVTDNNQWLVKKSVIIEYELEYQRGE